MAQASYSFLDVAALDEVRERFARGDALAVLSADLEEVIWANGPGAQLFGHADVETIFGAATPLGAAAKRQIAALRGFPEIGRDRALLVRVTLGMSSEALRFLASALTMPDGEKAILLAAPVLEGQEAEAARRAVGGFSQPGHFVAMLDRSGTVEAASNGFRRLGLTTQTLAALAAEATQDRPIVKRMLAGPRGRLPAGLARLTQERSLVVVIDENWADGAGDWSEEEDLAKAAADEAAPDEPVTGPEREIWYLGSEHAGDEAPPVWPMVEQMAQQMPVPLIEPVAGGDEGEAGPEAMALPATGDAAAGAETPIAAGTSEPIGDRAAASKGGDEPEEIAGADESENDAAEAAPSAGGKPVLPAGPLRFVWRTDGEGRISQISPEFAQAVGLKAADLTGRSFGEVSEALSLDPGGEIAGLLARRDTWSGRTVFWPVARDGLRVPVDLAALPVYDRNRNFEGFRGFGVARRGDAIQDAEGAELTLPARAAAGEAEPAKDDVTQAEPETGQAAPTQTKVIRLAEHRQPEAERPSEKTLSTGERIAFQQIAERLRRETAQREAEERDADERQAEQAAADRTEAQTEVEAGSPAVDNAVAAATIVDDAQADIADPEARKGPRPGLFLLDFAQWDEKGGEETPAAEAGTGTSVAAGTSGAAAQDREEQEDRSAALVEMDEAAAAETEAESGSEPEEAESAKDPDAVLLAGTAQDDDEAFAETDLGPVDPVVERALEAEETHHEAGRDEAALKETSRHEAGSGLSILEKLPVSVLVHSGDTLHYANDEFFALTGYASTAELAEAGGIGALFADSYEQAEEAGGEALRQPDRTMRITTRDGSELPVEAFLQSIPWNGGKALILVLSRVRDGAPSGQSPLIAELEARVAEMRTIIDTATDGVVLISREGDIRSISRPAEALFGLENDEVAGKPFASLFAIESQKSARDYLAGLSDHGVASVLNDGREVIGREAKGRFIPLFMTIGKLPGDGGYCAVMRDITQWKRAEEELTQARTTAERSSSHKSEFLARVSHEIRTPLNAIIGFSELMLDEKFGPVANNRYRDYLRDINRSGNHVLDLVNDLLDISKIEAGEQEMAYEAVSLNDALSETVALMQPQANRERVIIRSSFASNLPDVVADLRSVRQIALNVLSNAVRYTQAGGQVIVSTAYENGGEVVLRVRDTGIGMTQAEIEQALKPFKQINSLKRARGDGTGLGLPLTKAMVEANRATFSIHSTPGEGTLVEVSFPPTRVLAE